MIWIAVSERSESGQAYKAEHCDDDHDGAYDLVDLSHDFFSFILLQSFDRVRTAERRRGSDLCERNARVAVSFRGAAFLEVDWTTRVFTAAEFGRGHVPQSASPSWLSKLLLNRQKVNVDDSTLRVGGFRKQDRNILRREIALAGAPRLEGSFQVAECRDF